MSLPLPLADSPVQTIGLPILVALAWVPYHLRARTLGREGRPVPMWRQVCWAAGLVVLEVALSPPVDTLSGQLLVAHMAEHLLIGDIAALLLVLGLTGPIIGPLLRNRWVAHLRVLSHPAVAIVVWATNFYVWHTPALYQAALRDGALHALEHITFLAFGMAVWMALLGPLPKPRWFGNGAQLLFIVAVRLSGTVLANILIFSGTVFYPYYRPGDALWHISSLGDQVAAAGLMMVEESILTIALFCWLFLRVAAENEARQALLDYAAAHGLKLDERRAGRAVAAGRGAELWVRLRRAAGEEPPADGAEAAADGAETAADGAEAAADGAEAAADGAQAAPARSPQVPSGV